MTMLADFFREVGLNALRGAPKVELYARCNSVSNFTHWGAREVDDAIVSAVDLACDAHVSFLNAYAKGDPAVYSIPLVREVCAMVWDELQPQPSKET